MKSLMYPALQKFYSALKQLKQFETENSFFDNIGCLDSFLSEYRSTTLVLQKSLGDSNHPDYIKNRDEYLFKDKKIAEWMNDQRVTVIHKHPFSLKKVLRIVIYDFGNAVVFKKYERSLEKEEPISNYLQEIRDTLFSKLSPEINFSAQYIFVDEEDANEVNIFDFIGSGVFAMQQFLHAMNNDLRDESDVATTLMQEIDSMVLSLPPRWAMDVVDYCYYRSDDSFERGWLFMMALPDVRIPTDVFLKIVNQMSANVETFYEAFIYFHTLAYIEQKHHLLTVFFIEYEDGTYQTLNFAASIRTTMYRYINRVASIISKSKVLNVYLVTETVNYGGLGTQSIHEFLQLNYKERTAYREKTYLTFYKVTRLGEIEPVMMDADSLVDRLSVSVAMGNMNQSQFSSYYSVMLTPIVESFKAKLKKDE